MKKLIKFLIYASEEMKYEREKEGKIIDRDIYTNHFELIGLCVVVSLFVFDEASHHTVSAFGVGAKN